jgi:hypothetical protein
MRMRKFDPFLFQQFLLFSAATFDMCQRSQALVASEVISCLSLPVNVRKATLKNAGKNREVC